MTRVLHRDLRSELATAVRGAGPYLWDEEGRRYLDASGGAAVSCLGYDHPKIVDAITAQARELAFTHNAFLTTAPAERLAEFLTSRAAVVGRSFSSGVCRVALVSDGSEANETALKLARQYWLERGQPSRTWFISRHQSFHGNTLGALSVSGHRARRSRYEPYLSDKVDFIPPCYAYRCKRDGESDEAYGLRAANWLALAIERRGAENVAAFIAEPIVGATAGCVPPVPGYFRRIREICDQTGVLFIADEVMCGMGRTGSLFASAQEVAPDIITCAKGLAAGYQPIGAVLVSDSIVDAILNGTGVLGTGHTYMAHALACATALAVQQTIEEDRLLDNVRTMGAHLEGRLRERFADHPHVGDIRGRGLFWGLELVRDRASKEPFDPALALYALIKQEALRCGLICYPSGGTIDGVHGDHILLAPPYIVDTSHIDEAVDLLARTLDAVFQGSKVPGFQGSKVPGFQGSRVSRFQGSKVPGFQGSRVPGFQGSKVPGFQGSRVPRFQGSKVPKFLSS